MVCKIAVLPYKNFVNQILFLIKTLGEIKVIEKMDTEEMQPDQNSLDFKISGEFPDVINGMQKRLQPPQGLMTIPVSNVNMERKATPMEKSVIAVLPGGPTLLDGDTTTLIDMDRINDAGVIDEAGLLRVKQELCEVKISAAIGYNYYNIQTFLVSYAYLTEQDIYYTAKKK